LLSSAEGGHKDGLKILEIEDSEGGQGGGEPVPRKGKPKSSWKMRTTKTQLRSKKKLEKKPRCLRERYSRVHRLIMEVKGDEMIIKVEGERQKMRGPRGREHRQQHLSGIA